MFDFRITPDYSGPMTRVSCSTELEVNWPDSMDQKLGLCFPDLADGVTGARGLSGELWTFAHHGVLYSLESKYEIMFSDMLYADSQMVSGDYITDTRSGTYGTIVPWNTFTPLTHKTLLLHWPIRHFHSISGMVLTWEGSLCEARFFFAPPYHTFSSKSRNQVFFMDPTAGLVLESKSFTIILTFLYSLYKWVVIFARMQWEREEDISKQASQKMS